MAGGTANHSTIAVNVTSSLHQQLRGKPCRVFNGDLRIKVAQSQKSFNTYPDASIACPPLEWEKKRSHVKDTLLNPRVLFEVVTPATYDWDTMGKSDHYKLLNSLSDYIIIWQDRVRIEHFQRQDEKWFVQSYTHRTDAFALSDLEITLSLDEIYDGIDVPEDLRLFTEWEDD